MQYWRKRSPRVKGDRPFGNEPVGDIGFEIGSFVPRHQLVSREITLLKKENENLSVKVDTYVPEMNVQYPTDLNLLWDSGRKCIDLLGKNKG